MTVRAIVLAALLAGAPAPAGGTAPPPEATFRAPDGTLIYVRYGEPGGVQLQRRVLATDAANAESLFAAIEPGPDGADPTGAAAVDPASVPPVSAGAAPARTADRGEPDLAELVRALLREEIAASRSSGDPRGAPSRGVPSGSLLDADRGTSFGTIPRTPLPAERGGLRIIDERGRAVVVAPGGVAQAPPTTPAFPQATPAVPGDSAAVPPSSALATPRADERFVAAPYPPVPTPAIVRERILDEGLFRTNLVLFETSSAALLARSRDVLDAVGQALREFPEAQVRIEGHADARGSDSFNLALSQRRADAVREYLLSCCALDPARIQALGFGEQVPLVPGGSPTALAMNRRVEFRILNPETLRR